METTYRHLINPFDVVTRTSFKLMKLIATDHRDKLLNPSIIDADITDLYNNVIKPPFDNFILTYSTVLAEIGRYGRRTREFETLIKRLSTDKIELWDIQIQNVYRRDSPEYHELLPNYRTPFQSSTYDNRIAAVLALSMTLGDFVSLAAIKADVDAFHNDLITLRSEQQGFEGNLAQTRTTLEEQRVALAVALHRSFSFLIYKYSSNAERVAGFFELHYLRSYEGSGNSGNNSTDTEIIRTIAANEKLVLWQGVLTNDNVITFKNTGTTDLIVYAAPDAEAPQNAEAQTIVAGQTSEMYAGDLTSEQANVLIVINTANHSGSFRVALTL